MTLHDAQERRRASVRAARPCRLRYGRWLAGSFQRRTPLRPDAAGADGSGRAAQGVQGARARAARRGVRRRGPRRAPEGTAHADQGGPARSEDPGRRRQHLCLRGAVPVRHLAAPLGPHRAGRARRHAWSRRSSRCCCARSTTAARPCATMSSPAASSAISRPASMSTTAPARRARRATAATSSSGWCSPAARPSIARAASAS